MRHIFVSDDESEYVIRVHLFQYVEHTYVVTNSKLLISFRISVCLMICNLRCLRESTQKTIKDLIFSENSLTLCQWGPCPFYALPSLINSWHIFITGCRLLELPMHR